MRRVLFVCYGNSIRSQMAETMLNYRGAGRFEAVSGGIRPAGSIHPMTIRALTEAGIPVGRMRSEDWTFNAEGVDAVITLSKLAKEELERDWPATPDGPIRAHWEFTDPIEIDAPGRVIPKRERFRFFCEVRNELRECIEMLVVAPERAIKGRAAFERLLHEIGRLD